MQSSKQQLLWGAKLAFGSALLGWIIWLVDWQDFSGRLRELSIPVFITLLFFGFADRTLMGWKWNILLRANGLRISTWRIISLYVVSNLIGAFTPGNLGADAYRVMALSPFGKNAAVLSTVVLERALGMLSLLLFVVASLPFSFSLLGSDGPTVPLLAIFGVVTIALMLALPLYPPLRKLADAFFASRSSKLSLKIHQFFIVFADQQRNWKVLSVFFTLTLVETCLFFFIAYLAATAAGLQVTPGFIFSIMPAVMFVLRLPISIQGIGLQEGLFAYSFCLAGNSVAQGVLVSLVWRLKDILAVYIPGALLLAFSPPLRENIREYPTSSCSDI